jgi:hypothetical protein
MLSSKIKISKPGLEWTQGLGRKKESNIYVESLLEKTSQKNT